MKLTAAVIATTVGVALADVIGFDISNWQPNVDFEEAYESGARFVFIKVS
jgi:GH25 family lysozyme M1 (1,4-beta-N-acetylmuramidase)